VSTPRRALVLGSGGATGIAWEIGVLAGLADGGVPLASEQVIGTSAGALVAARLTTGSTVEQLLAEVAEPTEPLGRAGPVALARLLAAQLYPSRRHALAWLGRRAERSWTPVSEAVWVAGLVPDLIGRPWPAPLVIVATEAASGRPAYFSARQPIDLAVAVAASCAMPGVFPAVQVDDRLYFDGGLRSPANLDLAAGADSVIALAPFGGSVRRHRRPSEQAKVLSAAVALLHPDAASRSAIGLDVLDPGRSARVAATGRDQGRDLAVRLGGNWPR
jgi:Predicted esterase of the alpha-beta hydrolase superfamily